MKARYKKPDEKVPGVDSVIVSVDFTNGVDKSVLIVGRKHGKNIDIVNAFQGAEAEELYYRLLGDDKKVFMDEVDELRSMVNL